MGVRLAFFTFVLICFAAGVSAAAETTIRVGSLRYGTLSWQLDVIAAHALDRKHAIRIDQLELAGAPAAQLALQAGRVNLIVSDWLWVWRQRAESGDATFIPFSSALGGLVIPATSKIDDIPGLAGQRLGIAGSAIDKSWLILRLYARSIFGIDLNAVAEKSFGAPPLLSEELTAGRLDAVLTYWPFVAKLEAKGMRRLLSMSEAISALGIRGDLPLTGYVFSERWARENPAALDAFVAATREANQVLASSDAEWERIAPLTGAADHAELVELRDAYREGIPRRWDDSERQSAAKLGGLLASIGGAALVGSSVEIAPGTFFGEAGR